MRIKQKLLTGFLFVSLLPLVINNVNSLFMLEKTENAFHLLGEKILPGNVAMSRMIAELYHTAFLLGEYEENPSFEIQGEIETTLSELEVHRTEHDLFHEHDALTAQIEQHLQEFSRSVAQYLLLQQKGTSMQQLREMRMQIQKLLQHFVQSINPHIEREFAVNHQKVADIQQQNIRARNMLLLNALVTLAFAFLLSFFIAHLLSQPLLSLRNAAQKIGSGRFDLALQVTSRDEIGDLACAFNEMAGKLSATHTELVAARDYIHSVVNSMIDGLLVVSPTGTIQTVNAAACLLLNRTEDEITGRPLQTFFDSEIFSAENLQRLATCDAIRDLNIEFKSRADENIPMSISGAPIRERDGGTIGMVLVFRDLSDKERIEKERLKIKKLESIGVLAGGIAHDFNNILAAILGNINLAQHRLNPQDKMHRLLSNAEKATLRATNLTQQLLTFSKGGEPVKKLAAITEIIRESSQFVLLGSNVRCEYHFNENLWPVEVDAGQIGQVINNIVINADQAMPEGGIIEISCENIPLDEVLNLALEVTSPCVKITIRDRGIGIPTEHLEKIFDPYFSTKSSGSGLGMAITHSIIKKHQGHISATSSIGEGATFTILLPAAENISLVAIPDNSAPMVTGGKPLRILLMDDEEMLLEMSTRMLASMGHESSIVKDGAKAIELYMKALDEGKPFDLTIMDLTIPGAMGGKEAGQAILNIDKQAKLIASSGYSNDPIMANPGKFGFAGAIAKPYRLNDLAATIEAALARDKA